MNQRAICLISGGLDSFVAAAIARKTHEIFGLTVNYSQRHRKEIEAARNIARFLDMRDHRIVSIDLSWVHSALTCPEEPIPERETPGEIPATYVPARNTLLIGLALVYAEDVDADSIYLGINHLDYSGYPDCRPEYLDAFQRLINIATKKTIEGGSITLKAPLINLKKSEIVLLGNRLGLDFSLSWSCYRGGDKACGRCPSCLIRLRGFEEAGLKDPLSYEMV